MRKPKTAWGLSRQTEARYDKALTDFKAYLLKALDGASTPADISRRLALVRSSPEFIHFTNLSAQNMAKQVYRESGIQWRRLAQQAQTARGRAIYQALQREVGTGAINEAINKIVRENAQLIQTIPDRLDKEMVSLMAKDTAFAGLRPDAMMKELRSRFDHLLDWQLKRIARTECSKAYTALTEARARSLGLGFYYWLSARDGERVRAGHRLMDGVLVSWDEPPNPELLVGEPHNKRPYQVRHDAYHAGNIWNCRCVPLPVLGLDDISWPQKIYWQGRIQSVGRKTFEKIFTLRR